jgi:hypothetical protein
MPKWDSGNNDCEEQDLIMQVGPRHARQVKRMRSRLQKAQSHAVVDGKETSVPRGALCPVYWDDHGRQLMAYAPRGNARVALSQRDPVEAVSNEGL